MFPVPPTLDKKIKNGGKLQKISILQKLAASEQIRTAPAK